MSHSLIGADRRMHCKIVAVALAGALTLVVIGTTSRVHDQPAPGQLARDLLVKAGTGTFASVDTLTVR